MPSVSQSRWRFAAPLRCVANAHAPTAHPYCSRPRLLPSGLPRTNAGGAKLVIGAAEKRGAKEEGAQLVERRVADKKTAQRSAYRRETACVGGGEGQGEGNRDTAVETAVAEQAAYRPRGAAESEGSRGTVVQAWDGNHGSNGAAVARNVRRTDDAAANAGAGGKGLRRRKTGLLWWKGAHVRAAVA